jgi:hypothetical protein
MTAARDDQLPEPHVSIVVDGAVLFRGETSAIPREGDRLVYNGDVVRVKSVTWKYGEDRSTVAVEVAIGEREYTF